MSLGDDLLDAIVAAPEDPAARLVYADHRLGFSANDPHAELIIVQERLAELEATGLWRNVFSNEAEQLREREKLLISAVSRSMDVRNLDARWRRGFVDRLSLNDHSPGHLARRIAHPALRLVRTLHFQGVGIDLAPIAADLAPTVRRLEGYFGDGDARALGRIDEASVFFHDTHRLRALSGLEPLERLELGELRSVAPDRVQRDLTWGVRAARRELEREEAEHAAAQRAELIRAIPTLPSARHLVLTTDGPLERAAIAALARYPGRGALESVCLHAGAEDAGEALAGLGLAFGAIRFEAVRDADRELAARAEIALARACMAFGRFAEAAAHCDDAYCFTEGRSPRVVDRFEEASRAAGLTRRLEEPDPERDGLLHRVPALLRFGKIERVLAVAPEHGGAWALAGLRRRDEHDLDGAEAAFARALALDGEPAARELAEAHALMLDDPPSALAALNRAPPGPHANLLFASIHALQSKPDVALGLLRDEPHPLARLAVGLLERQRGKPALGREIWKELARKPYEETDRARWVVCYFAATLAALEPYERRRAFHAFLETAEPRAPSAALVFDPVIRVASTSMPQVDLTMVSREVDRLRGA